MSNILNLEQTVNSEDRDFFILSKGHGCMALYAVLHKFNFLNIHSGIFLIIHIISCHIHFV